MQSEYQSGLDAKRSATETCKSPAVYVCVVAIILCIYCYPSLRTTAATRSMILPPICAPDLGLYLNVSTLESGSDGQVVNPFYRNNIPAHGTGYLKFGFATTTFGELTASLGGRMWLALFLWNLVWWTLLCLSALWLFERFPTQRSQLLTLAGLALLMLFNIGMLKPLVVTLLHTHSISSLDAIELPFIRSFYPQVVMPMLLLYLGLQMRAMQKANDLRPWAIMGVLQFLAFGAFPYATLMMAGISATTGLWWLFSKNKTVRWEVALGYGILCAIADLGFLMHGSGAFRTGNPAQSSFFHLEASLLPELMGKTWVALGLLTLTVALSRRISSEVKWPLVGLGITNMTLLLGDAFIPQRTLFLTGHASYFEHATFVILLLFLVSTLGVGRMPQSPFQKYSLVTVICGLLLYGSFLALGNYRRALPYNQEQADLTRWLVPKTLNGTSLVITHYDTSAWVPLVSGAQVLYNRGAQAILPPAQNQEIQRFREILYLYFTGKDGRWVERVTANSDSAAPLERYGLWGDISAYRGDALVHRLAYLRNELTPVFDRIERHDPSVGDFFRGFKHVWIIDDRRNPIFDATRLSMYFNLESEETSGTLRIVSASPK